MADENKILPKNKNSLPGFVRGTIAHIQRAIEEEKISAPCFCFITDEGKKCLGFYDIDGVLYQINIERIEKLEESVANMNDPETGEPISVPEYVERNLEPVQSQVEIITQQSSVTQERVEQLSNAITMITGKDLQTQPEPEPAPIPPENENEENENQEENNEEETEPSEGLDEEETPTTPPINEESEVENNG